MKDLIILFSVLILLGVLVKLKIDIGVTILLSALAFAILKGFSLARIIKSFYYVSISWETIKITLIVVVITYFAELLKEANFLSEMVKSFSAISSPRFFLPFFAFIIGALPMPGGALVSAPLVEEGGKSSNTAPEEKTAINFWFRHIWEPVSPLYPDMILASSILSVSILHIIAIQWPLPLFMFFSGLIFLIPSISNKNIKRRKGNIQIYQELTLSVMPIAIVLLLILIFRMSIIVAGLIGIGYTIVFGKLKLKNLVKAFRWKFLLKLAILMFSIFYLKYIVIQSNIINGVYTYLNVLNVPAFLILFFLPFVVSLMTGAAAATVGVSYPLLLPLLKTPQLNAIHLFIAFLGGWTALMLTPTHLCLSLSIEYFNAKIAKVYQLIMKNVLFLLLASVLWIIIMQRFY